jgi:cytochrome oxidase assembly protein ShyY1
MRFPLIPTILVAAAVAAMIALGVWQLGRARERDGLIERHRQNRNLPEMALPVGRAVDDSVLFRRASAYCVEVTSWRRLGGSSASGVSGTRFIADCRTGAEGPGFAADMGVSRDPKTEPRWEGGEVTGIVVPEPAREGLFDRILRRTAPARPMLVSLNPAPGLEPSRMPSPGTNSSWQYAAQWFLFAAMAAIIYLLALRRRRPGAVEEPPPAA